MIDFFTGVEIFLTASQNRPNTYASPCISTFLNNGQMTIRYLGWILVFKNILFYFSVCWRIRKLCNCKFYLWHHWFRNHKTIQYQGDLGVSLSNVWFMSFGQSVECQTWCWMSNICFCYIPLLTAPKFYNLGHIQGIIRVKLFKRDHF